MHLEQHGYPAIENPAPDQIREAVRSIHPTKNAFVILTNSKGNYLQAAGARLRLTIEYRSQSEGGFRHYRVGNIPASADQVAINCAVGPISVYRNEMLTADDCLIIFDAFQAGRFPPEDYRLRDLSDLFDN